MRIETFTFRTDDKLGGAIRNIAKRLHKRKSTIIRMALSEYLRSELPPGYDPREEYVDDDS